MEENINDIENIYFEIVKKQSILATQEFELNKIFESAGVDRLGNSKF